jgi:hypothetical protein
MSRRRSEDHGDQKTDAANRNPAAASKGAAPVRTATPGGPSGRQDGAASGGPAEQNKEGASGGLVAPAEDGASSGGRAAKNKDAASGLRAEQKDGAASGGRAGKNKEGASGRPASQKDGVAPGGPSGRQDGAASGRPAGQKDGAAPGGPVAPADDGDPYAGQNLTVIGNFRVLPFADRFPLIEGREFEELINSIQLFGQDAPVELYKGLLAEGRNRVRAIEELKRRGCDIEVRAVEWQPRGDETIEQHIYLANVARRHLTDDQRVALAAELLPKIRAANARRQAATRFGAKSSACVNSKTPAADPDQSPPTPAGTPRTTTAHLASLAAVSPHKAQNAIKLYDGVEAGEIPREELTQVEQGKKPLRDALPPSSKRPTTKRPAEGRSRPADAKVENPAGPEGPAAEDDANAPAATEEEVRRRWRRFKDSFAVTDHRELRTLILKIVAEERAAFDKIR